MKIGLYQNALNFSNFFTNLTEKLGYHSNEIGKN
jgi:hypothetical protein